MTCLQPSCSHSLCRAAALAARRQSHADACSSGSSAASPARGGLGARERAANARGAAILLRRGRAPAHVAARGPRAARRLVCAAAAPDDDGGGGGGGNAGAPQPPRPPQSAAPSASPAASAPLSAVDDVAAALGLDPRELEPEDSANVADGVADGVAGGADGAAGAPALALAPLLNAVTEEISFRWRSATAGRWSPTATPAPGPCTPYMYLDSRLKPVDNARYAAAGLLPYLAEEGVNDALAALGAAGGGMELIVGGGADAPDAPRRVLAPPGPGASDSPLAGLYVLLARQGPGKRRKTLVARLLLLGGKREGGDAGPLATALREAKEETAGLLNNTSVRRELLGPVLWVPQGRFALFLYSMPPRQRGELPSAFEARSKAPSCEVDALEWVPLVEVLARSRAARRGVAPFARHVMTAPPLIRFFVTAAEVAQARLAKQLRKAPPATPSALLGDAKPPPHAQNSPPPAGALAPTAPMNGGPRPPKPPPPPPPRADREIGAGRARALPAPALHAAALRWRAPHVRPPRWRAAALRARRW